MKRTTLILAAAFGGTVALFLTWAVYGKPSLSLVCNGVLAGLVGITAGCDVVSIGGSAIIGTVCGAAMVGSVAFIDKIFGIRVEPRIEEEGLDVYEHGESAYNA